MTETPFQASPRSALAPPLLPCTPQASALPSSPSSPYSSSVLSSLGPTDDPNTSPIFHPVANTRIRTPRDRATPRSRSPSLGPRPLSAIQTQLRSNPSASHLSLITSVPVPINHHESSNSLRRPVDVIPAGTMGVGMPSELDFRSVVGSPSGGFAESMRRASSTSSLSFPKRAGSIDERGGLGIIVAERGRDHVEAGGEPDDSSAFPPNHHPIPPSHIISNPFSSSGLPSPSPFSSARAHIRSQGARPSTPNQHVSPLIGTASHSHTSSPRITSSAFLSGQLDQPSSHTVDSLPYGSTPFAIPHGNLLPTLPSPAPFMSESEEKPLSSFPFLVPAVQTPPIQGSTPLLFDATEDVLVQAAAKLGLGSPAELTWSPPSALENPPSVGSIEAPLDGEYGRTITGHVRVMSIVSASKFAADKCLPFCFLMYGL